jgi:leader peptidase (prepilin peptidase)/N-methyltransferase
MRPRSADLPAIVIASLAAATAAWASLFSPADILACAILAGLMAVVAVEDLQSFQVLDVVVALTALSGAAWHLSDAWLTGASLATTTAMLGLHVAICGGAFLLVREGYYRLKGVDGLGLGDVKLAFAAGTWIAWDMFATATLLASTAALTIVGVTIVRHGTWSPDRRIPLAASLAPAIWIVWFAGRWGQI